jgi:hypothetical protein
MRRWDRDGLVAVDDLVEVIIDHPQGDEDRDSLANPSGPCSGIPYRHNSFSLPVRFAPATSSCDAATVPLLGISVSARFPDEVLDLLFAVGAPVFSKALPVEACKTGPEVAPQPVFGWLNFSSAYNAGVHFQLSFHVRFSMAKAPFIAWTERLPCSQSAWRTPTDGAADPFLTDRDCSGFRARFAPERDRSVRTRGRKQRLRPHITC